MCDLNTEIGEIIDASCFGMSDGTVRVNVLNASTPPTFILDETITQNNGNFIGLLSAGLHQITIDEQNGCIDTLEFMVGQPDSVVLQIDTDSVSCFGGRDGLAGIQATGGNGDFDINWFTSRGVINDPYALNLPKGVYEVTIDAGDCPTDRRMVEIFEPDSIAINLVATDPLCHDSDDGSIVPLVSGGTSGYRFLWSNGAQDSIVNDLIPYDYRLVVSDYYGCTARALTTLEAPEELQLSMQPDEVSCFDGSDEELI